MGGRCAVVSAPTLKLVQQFMQSGLAEKGPPAGCDTFPSLVPGSEAVRDHCHTGLVAAGTVAAGALNAGACASSTTAVGSTSLKVRQVSSVAQPVSSGSGPLSGLPSQPAINRTAIKNER